MKNTRFSGLLRLLIVLIMALALRVFDYRNTSLDYDEHKTILNELPLIDREHILGYFTLRNVWDYSHINKNHVGINNSICFPLYYIPMRVVYSVRSDLATLRLATITWGIATLVLFYVLGTLYGEHVGWLGAVLMLFHPWAYHHTLQIRFYECWAVVAIVALLFTKTFIRKWKSKKCTTLNCLVYGMMVLLPGTVHAFGVVNTLFILTYTVLELKAETIVLAKSYWRPFTAVFTVMGVIIGSNLAVFGYATLIEGQAEGWDNSSSVIQIAGSFIFNVGYMLPLLICAALLIVLKTRAWDRFPDFLHLTLALIISFSPVALIVLPRPNVFRADFLYGMLPYVLLLGALSIEAIVELLFKGEYATTVRAAIAAVIVLSTLPTFMSNLLIDKDRLPHQVAAREIESMPQAKVYAPNPNYFNYYLGATRVLDIRRANENYNDSGIDEYFYIPVRKGMSTQFFFDFKRISGMSLIRIIGRDRLDLRANHIYVFIRRGRVNSH